MKTRATPHPHKKSSPQKAEPGWLLTPEQLPPLKETHVIKQIKDFLEFRGWMLLRCHVGLVVPYRCLMRVMEAHWKHDPALIAKAEKDAKSSVIDLCEEGTFDYVALHPVFGVQWIEFKRPGGKIRDSQKVWYGKITKAYRFTAVIVDNIDEYIPWYMATYHPKQCVA